MRKLLFIAILLSSQVLLAQVGQPQALLDTSKIRIGEQAKIALSLSYRVNDGEMDIKFPSFTDTITGKIEIVRAGKVDTALIDKKNDPYAFRRTQELVITSFEEGFWAIPPFQFSINGDTVETLPLLLEVQTVEIDTTQAIRDIKEIYEVPYTFTDWLKDNWQWVAGGAGVLAVLALVLFLIFRKKPMEEEPVEDPEIPDYLRALLALDELEKQELWQKGNVKLYYVELTEILRGYIEERYKVHALEFTTAQLMAALSFTEMPADKRERLNNLLQMADMVKFAKAKPIIGENEMALRTARELIEQTRDRSAELTKSDAPE